MQVLLISANRERSPYPVAPLGIAYVAASLIEAGHRVRVLDLCFEDDGPAAAAAAARSFGADLIGLSIRNVDNLTYPASVFYLPAAREVVARLKEVSDAPVVVGGPGFSIFPREVLAYTGADYGIRGEGEGSLVRLVEALEGGGDVDGVPNLLRPGGGAKGTARFDEDFGRLAPARSLLDNGRYLEEGGMGSVQTKRGCPFSCTYCTYPMIEGRRLRLREPAEVAEEIEALAGRHGVDYIFFVDDIFNSPEEHAHLICEEMIRRNIRVRWTCFATPRTMSAALLDVMKRAGCMAVEFGTDGGGDSTLAALDKGFTADDVARAQHLCDRAGLEAAHYLILGGPGETEQTLAGTFSFMERIRPRAVIAMLGVRVYPGTGLAGRALEEGVIGRGEPLLEPVFYFSPHLPARRLVEMVREYALSRPNWIVPGLHIRTGAETVAMLRRLGRRGPLWDLLARG
ncbi:MAG TPA: radical SAM protein [Deltaproteobacteria bacterium]|nr:radical SAM protein [Deltaproteobacteria bacterium]